MKIIENWLEPELIEYLHEQFLYNTPHIILNAQVLIHYFILMILIVAIFYLDI